VAYPVTFEADYVEQRNRLSTFFRFILAIPLLIVAYIYGIVAFFVIVIAWFAIVITGRFPPALYDFTAGFTRFISRSGGYLLLMTDKYPAFWGNPDDSYPIRMHFAGPLPVYSRLKTAFRIILAIPILILRYVMQLLLEIGALAAWFVIVITGKQPKGLQDMLLLGMSYTARSDAYIWLLTETYPPFQDAGGQLQSATSGQLPSTPPPSVPPAAPEAPPPPPQARPGPPAPPPGPETP
jgi:uncharacterized protein DUF4389